ncbi:MAG: hypothetical protein NW208_08095 [Bryobacter sp.]|nr:hypothetical protein [Bryobacter sp.]
MLSSIAAVPGPLAAIGEGFQYPPVESLKSKVTLDKVTIGVQPFSTAELTAKVFGKVDPNKYEVLPVLLGIKNERTGALRCSPLDLQYIVPGLGKVEALAPDEVLYAGDAPSRPNLGPRPLPLPRRKKKNPLSAPEIEGKAFAAKMIAAGDVAYGFVYFNVKHRANAKFYLSGLVDATTQQALFYFEIPFEE